MLAKSQVVVGDPKELICDITAELNADLLVMGCRSLGAIKRSDILFSCIVNLLIIPIFDGTLMVNLIYLHQIVTINHDLIFNCTLMILKYIMYTVYPIQKLLL